MPNKLTKTIKSLRKLLEMAYHHAWGTHGSADLRDEWRTLRDCIKEQFPIGDMLYCGNGEFKWSRKRSKDV